MSTMTDMLNDIEETAMPIFLEWYSDGLSTTPEDFCRDFVRTIVAETLEAESDRYREGGPTIVAITVGEDARDARLAAQGAQTTGGQE